MDWSDVFFSETVDDEVQLVQDRPASLYDSCCPPFVSPLMRHVLNERLRLLKLLRRDGRSMAIQTSIIEKINALIRRNHFLQ